MSLPDSALARRHPLPNAASPVETLHFTAATKGARIASAAPHPRAFRSPSSTQTQGVCPAATRGLLIGLRLASGLAGRGHGSNRRLSGRGADPFENLRHMV